MKTEREPKLAPRMQRALEELKGLVRERYPDATFRVTRSPEDPRSIHLMTTVDVEDTDAVLDVLIDRVMELQIEERLPIHVIPVRPRERVLAMLGAEQDAPQTGMPPLSSSPTACANSAPDCSQPI
jgi:hypothetical protein